MANKYKVNTLEEGYTGLIAGVSFVNGEGNTSDEWAINWFRENGYSITEVQETMEESKEEKTSKKSKK